MRIAACQMVSGLDPQENLQTALNLIDSAVQSGAEFIILPEHFALIPKNDEDFLSIAETFGQGPIQEALSEVAKNEQVWLCAGSLPLKTDDERRFTNTSLIFCPNGEVRARYDKIHMFQFDRDNEHYHESSTTQPGHETVQTGIECWDGQWTIGLSIGFDFRFPEMFRRFNKPDIVTLPAAITTYTGRAHWETLVRARAIENQCYVIACTQGGQHAAGRQTWGHSMVVDPWGVMVAELTEGAGVLLADISMERIKQVRHALPTFNSRVL